MRLFGRILQIGALILLPASMFLQLGDALGRHVGVSDMLIMMIFGILMFVTGRYFEGYAAS